MIGLVGLLAVAPLVIQPPACRPAWLDVDALAEMIRAETGTTAYSRVALRVVDCEEPNTVEVVATSSVAKHERTIPLADVPTEARLRTLALAVAEIRLPAPAPVVDAIDPDSQKIPTVAHRPKPPSAPLRLALRGTVDVFTSVTTALPGLRLAVDIPVAKDGTVTVGADANIGFIRERHDLGSVDLTVATGALRAAVCPQIGRVQLCTGPRVAIGWAHVRGRATEGTTIAAGGGELVATAGIDLVLLYLLDERWTAELELGGALVLDGIAARADGEPVLGIDGIGIVVGVGVGRRW